MKPMCIQCIICTDTFTTDSEISVIHCGHLFHAECLQIWLNSEQKTCPQCRCAATTRTIIPRLFVTETETEEQKNEYANITLVSQIANHNEELGDEIETLRENLKENEEQLMSQSALLQKKEEKIFELETNYKNALHELEVLKKLLETANNSDNNESPRVDRKKRKIVRSVPTVALKVKREINA